MNTTNISTNLKELRKKNHYSQTYVAERLNISRQAISRWETGDTAPDLDNLVLLAKLYNTSVDDILGIPNESTTSKENTASLSSSLITFLEVIGLSVILMLSTLFPFAPIIISVFIAFWLKCNKRNYFLVYILCAICLVIGTYNTYIFFMHFIPNNGITTITSI